MSDYTPDWTELRDCYAIHMETHAGEALHEARRDAERGIAKVRADALRETRQEIVDALPSAPNKAHEDRMKYAIGFLGAYAAQIEEEARG